MRLNTTGIAARMMLSLDKKAIGEKLINGRQINPTPLQVRYPQGVREVLGIMSEQLAISTADLTRILLEDALHNMFMPADNTTGNIISRIEYIMLSHDINAPLLATLLSPWNIRSTVIQDPARLADYLSADALEHLAECFNLNPDWLNGHENYPMRCPVNGQILLIISECLLVIAATLKLFSGIVSPSQEIRKENIAG